MAIERDIKVLYLDSKDLKSGVNNIHADSLDFNDEIVEKIKSFELVIFASAGVVPKIIKNRW